MNVEDLRALYDFNAWANLRILDACARLTPDQFAHNLGSSFGSVRDTLAHIYGAEWVWLERWHGHVPSTLPSSLDFPDFQSIRSGLAGIDGKLVDYVTSLTTERVQGIVQYKTTAGTVQAQPLWQMLQHLVNHGTYHRGQVTTLLRQLEAKAVGTDLITFYRERTAQASA
jgi:uncharacterized damage-inducible protein DinB